MKTRFNISTIVHHIDTVLLNSSDFQCSVDKFEINRVQPEWYNYVLCGVKGMTEFLGLTSPVGMQCVVDGCVPKSAGLSSSSALVCCAALATMQANNHSRSKVLPHYEEVRVIQ